MPTLQEIFDLCVGHIIKQGEPSFDTNDGKCYYTHPTKPHLHCAAWPMLKEYSPDLEGYGASEFAICEAMGLAQNSDEVELVAALQKAHDCAARSNMFVEDFKRSAASAAFAFRLNPTFCR